jgi:hypothetical protein
MSLPVDLAESILRLRRLRSLRDPGVFARAAITVDRVFTTPDLKAVQVLIVPTEGDLQCLMELSDRAIAAHQKASPYQRADAAQDHPQLVDLRVMMIIFRHGGAYTCAPHTPNFRVLPKLPAGRMVDVQCETLTGASAGGTIPTQPRINIMHRINAIPIPAASPI